MQDFDHNRPSLTLNGLKTLKKHPHHLFFRSKNLSWTPLPSLQSARELWGLFETLKKNLKKKTFRVTWSYLLRGVLGLFLPKTAQISAILV